jgi:hypothetical protein
MKFKEPAASLFSIFATGVILFVLSGCQLQNGPHKVTIDPAEAQISTNPSGSENRGPWGVPRTGQTRKFMSADDGDLRVGRPWSEPRFTENRNGTVTDHLTGLMWTQNADKANGKTDWEEAVRGAAGCADGGFTDWRLPNRNELESLIDLGRSDPALSKGHPFTGVQSAYYWTSTTIANNEDNAWVVHFYIGFVTHDDKAGSHYVWYVRGGQ